MNISNIDSLTVIIATRNDPLLEATVDSLMKGGFDPTDQDGDGLIIIDDCSDEPIIIPQAVVIRNQHRLGPGPSRQRGADLVDSLAGQAAGSGSDWLMFCDSHMQFPNNWREIVERHLKASDVSEVWGSTYLSNRIWSSMWHDTIRVGGADFYWWKHREDKFSFCDLSPRRIKNELVYDVPAVLGGCYFIHSSWFKRIGGFSQMIGYGSEEPWLSWCTWLQGGQVRIMGNLPVVHIDQSMHEQVKPYLPEWEINKLLVLKRILSELEYSQFCSWLPVNSQAKQMVDAVNVAPKYDDVLDHRHVSMAFGLQTYDEAIGLMREHYDDQQKLCRQCHDRRWLMPSWDLLIPCSLCNSDGQLKVKRGYFSLEKIKS